MRNILHLAKKTGLTAKKYAIFFKLNGQQHFVNIQAVPLKDTTESHYLVVFQSASMSGINQPAAEPDNSAENATYNVSELRIEQLEKEISQARADMRAITDEQETANEELQSANEELLSGSEELQSMNEELETSKEELQSTNEEIMIVNKELIDRNDQLNNARLYTEGVINTVRDPLVILDSTLHVKRATSGFYKKFKTTEKQTEECYLFELGKGQWNIPELKELLEDVLPEKKELEDFEVNQTFPLIGKKVFLLNARHIISIYNEPLILLSIEDVTDRRKIEEGFAEAERLLAENRDRLKSAVDSAGIGIWDYDPQTGELVWDKRCKELIGLPASAPLDFPLYLSMIHPDDRERVEKKINESMDPAYSGEFDIEHRTIPVNEKTKWVKGRGKVYFTDGKATRFVGTLLDITIEKQLEESTKELLRKKDEFISVASHELKTPITSLKAALQMIEKIMPKIDETKPLQIFVEKAIKQINKLVELIADLLDVTKLQSGKLELRKSNFMLDDLVKDCCDEMKSNALKHALLIEGDTGIEINADRNRMEQVLINLVSNAIKYSPGADKVIITLSKTGSGVKIAVTDFGIGIPESKQALLFDRFYRVDETSQRYAGLGLGLYISSEIVKQHNSKIYIESEEGKGSTFWFELPF